MTKGRQKSRRGTCNRGAETARGRQRHPTPRYLVPLSSRRRRAAAVAPTSGFCSSASRSFRFCSRRSIPVTIASVNAACSAASRAICVSILLAALAAAAILYSPLVVFGFSMPVARGNVLAPPLRAGFCTPSRSKRIFAPFFALTFTSLAWISCAVVPAVLLFLQVIQPIAF